jgi:hypothetical protein
MLELLGAFLVSLALIGLFNLTKDSFKEKGKNHSIKLFITSIFFLIIGYLVFRISTPIFGPLIGLITLIIGGFLTFKFPSIDVQDPGFTDMGVLIGVFFFVLGLFWLIA